MIHPFIKAAGVNSEKEFYDKYRTSDDFFRVFPHMKNGGSINQKKDYYWNGNSYVKSTGNIDSGGSFSQYGGPIQPIKTAAYDMYKDGGIHINPKNKGKFNTTKKATGKSTEELTHSSNPVTRKRAIFAQNAAKWHHEYGGPLQKFINGGVPDDGPGGDHGDPGAYSPDGYYTGQRNSTQGTPFDLPANNTVPNPYAPTNTNTPDTMQQAYQPVADVNQQSTKINDPNKPIVSPDGPVGPGVNPNFQEPDYSQTKPRSTFNYQRAGNDLLGAGLMASSYWEGQKNQKNLAAFTRGQGLSSNVFGATAMNTAGNKGSYSPNSGYFRPDQSVVAKPTMQYPAVSKYGGQILPVRVAAYDMYANGGMTQGNYADPIANGNNFMHQNYGNSFAVDNWSGLYQRDGVQDWTGYGNDANLMKTQVPGGMGTQNQSGYQPAPTGRTRTQRDNYHTIENTDYSIDSVRQQKFGGQYAFGGTIVGTNGNSPNVNNVWQPGGTQNGYGMENTKQPYAMKKTLQEVPEGEEVPNMINAEKNEMVMGDFNGDGTQALMDVAGPPHTAGGKNIAVPDNSFVFSDTQRLKIKDPEILKLFNQTKSATPAKIAKQYDLQKFTKVLQDPKSDQTSKKTAELMVANYTQKLNELSQIQEGLKAKLGLGNPNQQAMGNIGESKYGGNPVYADGGYDPSGIHRNRYNESFDQDNTDMPFPGNTAVVTQPHQTTVRGKRSVPAQNPEYMGSQQAQDWFKQSGLPGVPPTGQPYTPPVSELPPTPNNIQQPSIGNNIGTSQNISTGTDNTSVPIGKGPKFDYTNPDKWAMANSAFNIANLHKYMPWEAPVNAVLPDTVFLDPTRALAANSEQANSASYNAALSGNSSNARANSAAAQGQAAGNAANIVGDYNNKNVMIANQASEQAVGITNQLLDRQGQRANRLHQGNVIANQQYDNAQREARNDTLATYTNAWKNRQGYDDLNQTNQYYYRDNQGRIQFRTPEDKTAYMNLVSGRGSASKFTSARDVYNHSIEQGLDRTTAMENASDWDRENTLQLRNRTKSEQTQGKNKTDVTTYGQQRDGGYVNSPLAKFFKANNR